VRTQQNEQRNNAYRNIQEGSKSSLIYKQGLRRASAKYSITFRTLQTLCMDFELGNLGDTRTFIEFCSNLAKVYDKHIFQCQDV